MKHYACQDAESVIDKEERVLGLMGYDANGNQGRVRYIYREREDNSNLAIPKPQTTPSTSTTFSPSVSPSMPNATLKTCRPPAPTSSPPTTASPDSRSSTTTGTPSLCLTIRRQSRSRIRFYRLEESGRVGGGGFRSIWPITQGWLRKQWPWSA